MFDILIIGGGHAGVEAAHISSQFSKLKVGLITMPGIGLASAPCNPAVGGVGKGQVVKELDSLGGLIGKLTDLSGIQYRTLNESKGYAVQSTRVQIDKVKYSEVAEDLLGKIDNLEIIFQKIESIKKVGEQFEVHSSEGRFLSKKLILTVGTFLNGKMHTGSAQTDGGREGCDKSGSIGALFENIKTHSSRFKTGTPARLNINSIDYDKLEEQPSDTTVGCFHYGHNYKSRFLPQKSCYLGYTNPDTMKIIRDNKEQSPMFNGQIKGVGARYCPSIEDKAYRYPDKDIHHVFIEPESHELNTVYPSGISTSLSRDIQDKMLQTIVGLSECKIESYGYAVEYDVIDTTQLNKTLEMIDIPGLYFAGQVNGTSGYEEAAGQGFIAGANACLSLLNRSPLILSRKDSYIGVMIEDLVTNLRDEPYRLFTARSENRLFIREDNSHLRMKKYRDVLDLNCDIDSYLSVFCEDFDFYFNALSKLFISPNDKFLKENKIIVPRRTTIAELIKQNNLDPIETLSKLFSYSGIRVDHALTRALAISIKYDGYINKSNQHQERVNKLDDKKIDWLDLMDSENISYECKQRIKRIKPESFGQLKLIEGIRPASLVAIAGTLN